MNKREIFVFFLVALIYDVSSSCTGPRTIVVQATAAPPQIVSANQVVTNQVVSNTCGCPTQCSSQCPGKPVPPKPCITNQVLPPQILNAPALNHQVIPAIYTNPITSPCVSNPVVPNPVFAATVSDNSVANSLAHALQLLIVSDLIEQKINSPRGCLPVVDTCVNLVADCVQKPNSGIFSGPIELYSGQVVESFAPLDGYYGVQEFGCPVTEIVLTPYNQCGCLSYSPSSIPSVNTNCGCCNQVPTYYV